MMFEKCRLYKLKSHKVLAEILGLPLQDLRKLASGSDSNYHQFPIIKNGKTRMVQEPKKHLKQVHKLLKYHLNQIPHPRYLYSGRKGVSYRDNAAVHTQCEQLVTMDIAKFYPSSKREYVYRFFRFDLQTSPDIADTLSSLLTVSDHIPTGSPASQILAFWAHYKLFESISDFAAKNNYVFSLYVDDITLSTTFKVSGGTHLQIASIIRRHQLKLKRSKVKYSRHGSEKKVTGCVISAQKSIEAPNLLKKKLFYPLKRYKWNIEKMPSSVRNSSVGRMHAVAFIEDKKMPNLQRYLLSAQP